MVGRKRIESRDGSGADPEPIWQGPKRLAGNRRVSDFQRKFRELVASSKSEGKTLKDLASLLKCHPGKVTKWGQGKGHPRPVELLELVKFYGVTFDYLCDPLVTDPTGISASNPAQSQIATSDPDDADTPTNTRPHLVTDKEWMLVNMARHIGIKLAIDRVTGLLSPDR